MVNVNSQRVTALLEMSLVNHCMVPVSNVDYSRQEEILCVHADKHRYPKADVTVTINEQSYMLSFLVVQSLPVDVIPGMEF